MPTITELLTSYRDRTGDSYADMSRKVRDELTKGRIQQLATAPPREFPKQARTVELLSELLDVPVTTIVLAFAAGLGIPVTQAPVAVILPPGTETLAAEDKQAIRTITRALIQARRANPDHGPINSPEPAEQSDYGLAHAAGSPRGSAFGPSRTTTPNPSDVIRRRPILSVAAARPACMTRGLHHPWRRLRHHHPNVMVEFRDLPDGLLGYTDVAGGRIVLDRSLTQAERRSVLAHELEHVERGGVVNDQHLCEREELIVDRLAARKLIGLRQLVQALLWSQHPHEVADDLWVDVATLRARLGDLTDAERTHLDERLEEAGRWLT